MIGKLARKFKLWVWILIGSIVFTACTTAKHLSAEKSVADPLVSVAPQLAKRLPNMPIVWVAPSLERIGRSQPPQSGTDINLNAARGEAESFQIVIQAPPNGLNNVNITITDLRGPNRQILPKQNITLYREHYVRVRQPSPQTKGTNPSLGAGWYPDALIPFVNPATGKPPTQGKLTAVPFKLEGKQNQPIWVDIFVPRTIGAGKYQGTFTVTSDRGKTQGKIALNVWNFELPLKPSLNSAFEFWNMKSKSAQIELLKHKLMPRTVNPEYQRELIDRWGLTSTNLSFWSEANVATCKMTAAPTVEQIRDRAKRYAPELLRYNYTADEIDRCPNLNPTIKQWARNLHAAGIPNLITMKPIPQLDDDGGGKGRSAVDIWVLLPNMYDEAKARVLQVLKRGNRVWSYNALVQDDYSPKWQIDFKPINYRIQPGFINQSLGLTGLIYWRTDLWTKDPWQDVQTYVDKKEYYPGEGMLFYPGEQVGIEGVVPSMRLKWLRDGVEDYEYVQILKQLGRQDLALKLARTAGRDWHNWTQDSRVLTSVRDRIATEIQNMTRIRQDRQTSY